MPKKILVLGITGVDKKKAIGRLLSFYKHERGVEDAPRVVDFETQYVQNITELHEYLDDKERAQRSTWDEAWDDFVEDNKDYDKDLFLLIHGVIVRKLYGFRSPLNFEKLRQWKPTDVITLIDDTYMSWFTTQKRSGGLEWKGKPTLEQLLTARRVETHMGDLIAKDCGARKHTRNYMLAVRHPARVLYRLIYGPGTKPIYLSFPISGPRKMERERREEEGRSDGINEVNAFIEKAAKFEQNNPNVCCFCPLAIDELPLEGIYKEVKDPSEATSKMDIDTITRRRWDVNNFWHEDSGATVLLTDDSLVSEIVDSGTDLELDTDQVTDSLGLIRTDVAHRDFRLVLQSKCLVVFNPWFDGEQSYGVDNEIACAYQHSIPIFVFQDPKHDPKNEAKTELNRQVGTLGGRPGQEYIAFYPQPDKPTLDHMFKDVKDEILS